MSDLITETPEACRWVAVACEKSRRTSDSVFGSFQAGVIWVDEPYSDGEIIGGRDPSAMIDQINNEGWPLYRGHDPGFPSGRSIAAKLFVSPSGRKFVVAILGFYANELRLSFGDLGVDSNPEVSSPSMLDSLDSDCQLDIATDPREVDPEWLKNVLRDAPLPVVQHELSHNAEEWKHELIRIGLPYVLFVWNPFVTTIAQEAAKDVYARTRQWLRNLLNELPSRKSPIVSLQSYQDGCEVSFLIRGKDVKCHYDAHDSLPIAAAQAASLISSMKSRNAAPLTLVYEFDSQLTRWFPSYATLEDGRLVSNQNMLIALEQHPTGLSIGIYKGENQLSKHK
ncbi:hypothetical protein Q2T42_12605 [Leptolyngbya boryana CZ1]|uniref:Uncharacterized protein n=1 Tax=Leptolyngbya boryana CZ1 TaxID=3060204 RepID=A0AA97ARJ5_LEPBY|nr:hypothetical protein [Leptolyngbya boryana]WNZ48668.1 hypothetical protein Q2T42_12605 [Leptolyngbya boryana CZ1]